MGERGWGAEGGPGSLQGATGYETGASWPPRPLWNRGIKRRERLVLFLRLEPKKLAVAPLLTESDLDPTPSPGLHEPWPSVPVHQGNLLV